MKRVLIALLFILAWAITASATQVTVGSYAVPLWQYGGTAAKLRIFATTSFQTSDGRQVIAGSPNQPGGFYLEVNVTVSGTTATIASFTIDSTTDGINTTACRYNAYFYTTDGRQLGAFGQFKNFFISPASGTSQTWTSISLYNYNQAGPPDVRFTFDDATIQRMFASINVFINPLTTTGDIIIGNPGSIPARLAIGSANQFLGVTGGLPAWQSLTIGQITTALAYTPVNRAGDTMTGLLTLSGDPSTNLQAATRQYVDARARTITSINTDQTAAQTFTVNASFSELTITDNAAGDHKFGLSGAIGVTHGGTGLATFAAGSLPYASALNTIAALSITGTANRVLRSNGTLPSWAQLVLTTDVSGILPSANGGSGNGFFAVTGPTTSLKTFTYPDASATVLTSAAAVTAVQGGTGLATYTTGDLIYASATNTLAKRAIGANNTVLHATGGVPVWSAVDVANDTTGTLPIARGGTGLTAFGSNGYIKASGGALTVQTAPLPIADGGANATGSAYTTNGLFIYSGSAFGTTAAGTTGTVLTGNTGSAPTFASSPTLTGLTLTGIAAGSNNSLVFANTSGALSADNTKLIWDSVNSRLSIKSVLRLLGGTSGNVDLQAPTSGGNLAITLPGTAGSLNQVLIVTASSAGAITLGYGTAAASSLTSINGQAAAAQVLSIANTGSSLTVAQISTNENQIRIPAAGSGISAGLITNGTQSLDGIKTLLTTLHAASGTTAAAPIIFDCSGCALLSSTTAGAMEYDGAALYFTRAVPSVARKTIAFTDSTISDGQLSSNVQLKTDKDTNSGYAGLNASGNVPLTHGGTGISLTIGAVGTFLRSDGTNIGFSTDGSGLTALNATQLTTGAVPDARLSANVEFNTNKNAANGYAGLSAGSKITASQMSEVLAVTDLTDYAAVSGTGTTAIRATITTPVNSDILTYNGTNWINSPPTAASAHNILSATHGDSVVGSVAQGDLLYGNATPKWDRLPIGAVGTHLRSSGTQMSWALVALSTDVSGTLAIGNGGTGQVTQQAAFNALAPTTTKGDLIVMNNAGNDVRQGIGTNNQVLVADSAQNNGLKWGAVVLSDSNAVSGVLQPANGGLGTSNTNGAYKMLPSDYIGTITTVGGGTVTANQVRVLRFHLADNLVVNRIVISVATVGATGNKVGFGIYAGDGNTLLVDGGSVTPTVGANVTALGSPVTLSPGFYYLAWTTAGTTQPTLNYATSAATFDQILNSSTVQYGTAANAATAGALPTTLGAITAFPTGSPATTAFNCAMVKLQN